MDYKKIYDALCISRKYRGTKKEDGYEIHHIVPKSMGGKDRVSNYVKFTYREHYIAHLLLSKITKGKDNIKMILALDLMSKTKDYSFVSSRVYKTIKDNATKARRLVIYKNCVSRANKHIEGAEYIPLKQLIVSGVSDYHQYTKHFDLKGDYNTPRKSKELVSILRIISFIGNNVPSRKGLIHFNKWYTENRTRQKILKELEEQGIIKLFKQAKDNIPLTIQTLVKIPLLHKLTIPYKSDHYRVKPTMTVPEGMFIIKDRQNKGKYLIRPLKFEFLPENYELYTKYCHRSFSSRELPDLLSK